MDKCWDKGMEIYNSLCFISLIVIFLTHASRWSRLCGDPSTVSFSGIHFWRGRTKEGKIVYTIVCKIDSLFFWYVNSHHCAFINILLCLSAPFKRSVGALEQQCTTISIISDECVEDDETFHLQLSTADESVMLNPATAYITIVNNDCKFLRPPLGNVCKNIKKDM